MVASKFLNDEGEEDEVFNTDWANSAKMDIKELNKLEREFLSAIVNTSIIYRILDLCSFKEMIETLESQ